MGFKIFMLVILLLTPAIMIGFGLAFRRAAPREINPLFGYRTSRSMKNRQTWEFAHRLIGKLWIRCGVLALLAGLVPMLIFITRDKDFIGDLGCILLYAQLALMILPIPGVERALRRSFDENGDPKA